MLPSSNGQDLWFSSIKSEFDSPWQYQILLSIYITNILFFDLLVKQLLKFARVVKLVDTWDLKSHGHCVRAGSIPAPSTNNLWKIGREVDCGSLENCCTERYRRFESYIFRCLKPIRVCQLRETLRLCYLRIKLDKMTLNNSSLKVQSVTF